MKTIIYLVRHAEANSNINPLEIDGKDNDSITELVYNHEKKNWKVRKVNG